MEVCRYSKNEARSDLVLTYRINKKEIIYGKRFINWIRAFRLYIIAEMTEIIHTSIYLSICLSVLSARL